jgi:AcrR family transcriptional regulator
MLTPGLQRAAQDRRQQIMDAAAELFALQGFRGTTTRQIADTARVNEAIIFRHFGRKEDLYRAVIEQKCLAGGKGTPPQKQSRGRNDSRGDVGRVFAAIAEEMLRRQSEDSTVTRLLLFSALESHRLSHRFFRAYVGDYYGRLAGHIREQIQHGVFRSIDPHLAARAFLGMVMYHFMSAELFEHSGSRRFSPKQVSSSLTKIWLDGMLNSSSHRGRRGEMLATGHGGYSSDLAGIARSMSPQPDNQ